jgi:hypothetical protein
MKIFIIIFINLLNFELDKLKKFEKIIKNLKFKIIIINKKICMAEMK